MGGKLRCAVVGLTGIGTRHALGLVGDDRVTLVAGCDDGYVRNTELCSYRRVWLVARSGHD